MIGHPSVERYHQKFEVPIGSRFPQIDTNINEYTFYGYVHTEEIPNNHVPTNSLTSTNVVTTSKNEMDNQAQSMKKICSNQLPSIESVYGRFILLMNSRYYSKMLWIKI